MDEVDSVQRTTLIRAHIDRKHFDDALELTNAEDHLPCDEDGLGTGGWVELLPEDGALGEVIEEEPEQANEVDWGGDQELGPDVEPEERLYVRSMHKVIESGQGLVRHFLSL